VSVDEMRQVTARRYRAMRDKLLNIPDRIAGDPRGRKRPGARARGAHGRTEAGAA
jgi:hypothetical protein